MLWRLLSLFNCTAEWSSAHSRCSVRAARVVEQMKPPWGWHSVCCSAVKMLSQLRLRKIFQFSYILYIFFLSFDGTITDNIFIVQIDEQDDGEQFKSGFHWDMKSNDVAATPNRQPLVNEVRGELWMGLVTEERMTYYANEMYSHYCFQTKSIRVSFIQFVIPTVYRRPSSTGSSITSTISAPVQSHLLLPSNYCVFVTENSHRLETKAARPSFDTSLSFTPSFLH